LEYSYLSLSLNYRIAPLNYRIAPLLSIDHLAEKFNVNKVDRSGGMVC
jgi:hypothetical protein